MTQLLEKAIEQIRTLAPADQDAIATLILQELEDEKRWDEAFASSQDKLSILAQKVRCDIMQGRETNLGF